MLIAVIFLFGLYVYVLLSCYMKLQCFVLLTTLNFVNILNYRPVQYSVTFYKVVDIRKYTTIMLSA